jgi:hypothetical protein
MPGDGRAAGGIYGAVGFPAHVMGAGAALGFEIPSSSSNSLLLSPIPQCLGNIDCAIHTSLGPIPLCFLPPVDQAWDGFSCGAC